ncbi:Hypothetical Protein FCC1311_081522 [Hondaea fermentalgiana]|uniref:Uncharacterized protein n=1 Tax=Hondaea fermentalgiana TaxID=2315210 RepID=A0A2R5GM19_9STRA|nr:Hypothetical Protein FCC1311_081522 [Hondaea fermentalgiana]|eukprot:GBG31927.1 Hypothetical Protein FCC1311_081522 [Hondaea fermentalgiana]
MGSAVSVASLEEDHKAALDVVETMAAEMEDGSKKTKDEIAEAVAAHEGNQLDKEKALALLAQIGDGGEAAAPAEGEAAPAEEGEAAKTEEAEAPAEEIPADA